MPVNHEILEGVLVVTASGAYTGAALRERLRMGLTEPDVQPDTTMLLDIRHSESVASRSIDDLRATVRFMAESTPHLRGACAILTQPGVGFGLMRMASVWADFAGMRVQVFTDEDEAWNWVRQNR